MHWKTTGLKYSICLRTKNSSTSHKTKTFLLIYSGPHLQKLKFSKYLICLTQKFPPPLDLTYKNILKYIWLVIFVKNYCQQKKLALKECCSIFQIVGKHHITLFVNIYTVMAKRILYLVPLKNLFFFYS